ncbi:MAG: galactokinase [Spirochaetales bacterium]|nr:galactokinase [Spirochaetales bacterium]
MKKDTFDTMLENKQLEGILSEYYPENEIPQQVDRFSALAKDFGSKFGDIDFSFFSTPGRTELGGNHTDHNHGCVIAGSVQLDTLAIATKSDDNKVELVSAGYPSVIVDLDNLDVVKGEQETTDSLVRGLAAAFKKHGLEIGGWKAITTSKVPGGSGLSSSAAIEVLIGTIFNHFYNNGKVSSVEIAKMSQWAENVYFGKPCGLMDQVACAHGGIVTIDFNDPSQPIINSLNFSFRKAGYCLMVVNTGGSHADLTDEYAAVPGEMKSVAKLLGQEVLRGLKFQDILENSVKIRENCGDRAFLRTIHFINENERAKNKAKALENNDIKRYFELVKESGNSSWKYLQNCMTGKDTAHQGITTALAITQEFLGYDGASRVHGGGFAGTIQVYIPSQRVDDYVNLMEKVFGEGSVTPLVVRAKGTSKVL